jgi:hypothetical protein
MGSKGVLDTKIDRPTDRLTIGHNINSTQLKSLQITDPTSRQRGRSKTKSKAIFRQNKIKSKTWSWAQRGARHQDMLTD